MFTKFFAKRALKKVLSNPKYSFRSIERCEEATGLDHETTVGLLYAVGARPAYRNDELWGLKSRVGVTGKRSQPGYNYGCGGND